MPCSGPPMCQWVSVGTSSMIYLPASLDQYGARVRPRAGISIRVIHEYLDTYGYSWVPINF